MAVPRFDGSIGEHPRSEPDDDAPCTACEQRAAVDAACYHLTALIDDDRTPPCWIPRLKTLATELIEEAPVEMAKYLRGSRTRACCEHVSRGDA